jgi:glycerophosphoryl diester phosphodiesterase
MKLLSLTAILLYGLAAFAQKPNLVPKQRHKFIVIAHRGDHTIYPENTLNGYAQAIKNEADYIEIDLRTTSDNQLVSMHDATVNRMTDGKGLVKDLTLDQIHALKVKGKMNADTATYSVPTFEQILKLCHNKIYIYIDFKEADASATLAMLKQYHMEKQVLVYINKPSQFTDWRKTDPTMPLMLSLPDSAKNTDGMMRFLNQYHPDVLDGDYTSYDKEMVALAQKMQIPVWPDAQSPVEGPFVWDKAIEKGLMGIQTDNPPALVKYLKQKGLR